MNDREFLQHLLSICETNTQCDWMFTELTPNEEFAEIQTLIERHLDESPVPPRSQ